MPLYLKDKMVSGISLGVPGKSAYEAAKEGGYTGTEEEFNQALTSVPGHITDTKNPHSVTAVQVGADAAGAANEALNSAKAYTDQIVAGVIPGDGSKESPTDSDSIFIYDNSDSGKPKKTLISKLVELFNNTFYTKTESDTLLQNKADTSSVYTKTESDTLLANKADASSVYSKTETNTLLQNKPDKNSVVNPNLLDNWYFGNPVDQRGGYVVPPGLTTYSDKTLQTVSGATSGYRLVLERTSTYTAFRNADGGTSYVAPGSETRGYVDAGYGIDRWKSLYTAPVVLIYDDGIVLQGVNGTNGWGQVIDKNIYGMTCTLSVLTETTLYSDTLTIPTSGNYELINKNIGSGWFYGIYKNTNDTGDAVLVRFFAVDSSNASPKIKAIKLELGSTQTLAHQDENGVWQLNEIPDYGEQLARCQRYQYPIKSADGMRNAIGYGYALSDITIRITVNLPAPMRELPSLEWLIGGISNLHLVCNNGTAQDFAPNSVSVYWSADVASVVLQFGVTGAIPLAVYTLCAYNAEVIPMLNANL